METNCNLAEAGGAVNRADRRNFARGKPPKYELIADTIFGIMQA